MTINIVMTKKPHSTKSISPYIGLSQRKGGRGRRPYEPSHIYRFLFDNTDKHGVVLYTLKELARTAIIDVNVLKYHISDMKKLGYITDHGRGYRLLKTPSEIEWNDELYDKLDELRKTHFSRYKKKKRRQ